MVDIRKSIVTRRSSLPFGASSCQTASTGFAEGQAEFSAAPKAKPAPSVELRQEAPRTAAPIHDEGLRQALETLARNVLNRHKTKEG